MKLLALDLASRTGFACADGSLVYHAATLDFRPKRLKLDPLTRQQVIFDRASSAISDLIDKHKPAVVVLEDSGSNLKGEAARVILGLRAVALVVLYRREVLVDTVSSSEWKCWAKRFLSWTADEKSDVADARNLVAYYLSVRLPKIQEAA